MRDRERHDHIEEHRELLTSAEVVLDARLAESWQFIWSLSEDDLREWPQNQLLGAMMRLAYLQGYGDARTEETPGQLYTELGVRDPLSPQPG